MPKLTQLLSLALLLALSTVRPLLACPEPTPMYPGGDNARRIEAQLRAGCDAVLAQGTVWPLETLSDQLGETGIALAAIDLAGTSNVSIYTAGLPWASSQKATLQMINSNSACAIRAIGMSNIQLRNIRIDGGGTNCYSVGPRKQCQDEGLVWLAGSGDIVDSCELFKARTWSHLVFENGSSFGQITNNIIGPADPAYPEFVDGISLQCLGCDVWQNQVTDVTDGGIVIFPSPYSTVHANQINSDTREAISGICIEDYQPNSGDDTGLQVFSNTIIANFFIRIGMGIGSFVKDCEAPGPLRGGGSARVYSNTLAGNNFGYGYLVDGVDGWSFTDNAIGFGFHQTGSPRSACVTPPSLVWALKHSPDNPNTTGLINFIEAPASLHGVYATRN